ncbi:MAG: aspartate aminotransferase family protein, partial [Candidatus Dormiibacterota bacterium]
AKEPMNELVAACRDLGFWPFSHFNRIHVAPPLVITAEELADGIGRLDQALTVADGHSEG